MTPVLGNSPAPEIFKLRTAYLAFKLIKLHRQLIRAVAKKYVCSDSRARNEMNTFVTGR
jgi:hypothetical protein